MTKEQITEAYKQLAMQLGDVQYRRDELDERIWQTKAQMRELNEQMARIQAGEQAANASAATVDQLLVDQ